MDALIGEIRAFPYNFAPLGWLPCNGAVYQVAQYTPLAAVIGNLYGGTPGKTFAVPNLAGVALAGVGTTPSGTTNYQQGVNVGTETVTLTTAQIPAHNHVFNGAVGGGSTRTAIPGATSYISNFANSGTNVLGYVPVATGINSTLAPQAIATSGGSTPHENRSPFLAIGYFINIDGDFPVKP